MDSFDSTTKKFKIPLLTDSVSAGFPSPADDYTEELARLILIEQIYRAISISNNSPYHRS